MKIILSYCEVVLTFISKHLWSLESSGMDSSLVCGSVEGTHPDTKGFNAPIMKLSAPKQVQGGLRKRGGDTGLACVEWVGVWSMVEVGGHGPNFPLAPKFAR